VEALDGDTPNEDEAKEVVSRLEIDVASLAANIRNHLQNLKADERKSRFAEAEIAYKREQQMLGRRSEPVRPRREQEVIIKSLIQQAGPNAVAAHFHKYEEANEEELAAMIASLRYLLGENES
jgi:hypothetical protein